MTKNTMMLKMCASKIGGFGCEFDGDFYFYEGKQEEAIGRILDHFLGYSIVLYTMEWARQTRIKEMMEYYESLPNGENKTLIEIVIANNISEWSGCSPAEAVKQIRAGRINYSVIK